MHRAEIERQDRYHIKRQRDYRLAADIVACSWATFPEVQAVAVIGSVAKPLWKDVPRFREFRRQGVEVWHECGDLDLALWIDSQERLGELRRAYARSLREAFEAGADMSVPANEIDVFLFEPGSDRYLGRLCRFNQCPKEKFDCLTPGCGAIPFNKVIPGFVPRADLLAPASFARLYERGTGFLRSALDLPTVGQD